MFRKQRRPTPNFKIPPPFDAISGEHADLQNEGTFPYCAMMQVAAEDVFDNYVICRGFDTRIAKFIDYEQGNADKPGISVAKPFGSRGTGVYDIGQGSARKYRIGEIFPAFLTAQGVNDYTPPSPANVPWRLGQNPGAAVETLTSGIWGGQPEGLGDTVSLLYDHRGVYINWMIIHTDTERKFRFQVHEVISSVKYLACVRQMNGEDAHMAEIHDPDEMFDGIEPGTKGLVFFQEGKYYIENAKCEPDPIVDCE